MSSVIVVPTYNERENLEELLGSLRRHARDCHVLIVDDNSPDGTGRLAEELRQRNPESVFVLHREKKEGLGRAYVSGFKKALEMGYEWILQMDADLSHDPEHVPPLREAGAKHDLALGSRYVRGISVLHWDLKRLILSQLASRYVQLITRMKFTDPTGGFKCWRRTALESIDLDRVFANGYLFQVEMTYKAFRNGCTVAEVPIVFRERKAGRSKIDWSIVFEAVWGVIRLRLSRTRKRTPAPEPGKKALGAAAAGGTMGSSKGQE
jgi:dolichol-phosphate mannosyltransferase